MNVTSLSRFHILTYLAPPFLHYYIQHATRPQIIEKNTRVRLKIVGTRVDATEIVSLVTHHLSPPLITSRR